MLENLEFIKLPTIPLRGMVAFPYTTLTFDVGREYSIKASKLAFNQNSEIFLVAQKSIMEDVPKFDGVYNIGVVAKVTQTVKVSDNVYRILVEVKNKAVVRDIYVKNSCIYCDIDIIDENEIISDETETIALVRVVKELFNKYAKLDNSIIIDDIIAVLESKNAYVILNKIASLMYCSFDEKQKLLEILDINEALEYLGVILAKEIDIIKMENEITDTVKKQIGGTHREYFLRQQLKTIKEELGEDDEEDDDDIIREYLHTINNLNLNETSYIKLRKEVKRLSQLNPQSQEASVITTYLDTCLALPFKKLTKDNKNLNNAKNVLEKEHFGLNKVKDRILEYVAVNNLTKNSSNTIICLVGPPGVGKTSIAKSISKSLKKKFIRISLGGVSDEAEIRGHRRTYIGAMPGKIIKAISSAECKNPVILLDEIDKITSNLRGDPSSALLEVLDKEQNKNFEDNYIEIPFDLSNVFFIATANNPANIPAPLRDRMDIINIDSYTREEKFNIAKKHLIKKEILENGLTQKQLKINDTAIYTIIDRYTKEAGVRSLQRNIAKICRKVAKEIVFDNVEKVTITPKNIVEYLGSYKFKDKETSKDSKVGVVNGLAWTAVGGDVMPIEVNIFDGTGKIQLTGRLGEVMKESAHIAINYIRSICDEFNIESNFYTKKDIHIHVPDGAIPKDGPSAGMALATAVLSFLTNSKLDPTVAMTGEITIRGSILPIGGLKEKAMGAYKDNIKKILIPFDNISDLDDVDNLLKENIEFVPVKHFTETIKHTFMDKKIYMKAINEHKKQNEVTLNC